MAESSGEPLPGDSRRGRVLEPQCGIFRAPTSWTLSPDIGLGGMLPTGRNGGAERTVWETLLEMERFGYNAGEMSQGGDHAAA